MDSEDNLALYEEEYLEEEEEEDIAEPNFVVEDVRSLINSKNVSTSVCGVQSKAEYDMVDIMDSEQVSRSKNQGASALFKRSHHIKQTARKNTRTSIRIQNRIDKEESDTGPPQRFLPYTHLRQDNSSQQLPPAKQKSNDYSVESLSQSTSTNKSATANKKLPMRGRPVQQASVGTHQSSEGEWACEHCEMLTYRLNSLKKKYQTLETEHNALSKKYKSAMATCENFHLVNPPVLSISTFMDLFEMIPEEM